jgi:hypothetical protein
MSNGNYSVAFSIDYDTRSVAIATFYTDPITQETEMDGEPTIIENEKWWDMTEQEMKDDVESLHEQFMSFKH